MRRRLSNFVVALSSVLLVATVLLWVRSYYVREHIAHAKMQGAATVVRSSQGAIYLDHRSNWDYAGGWTWGRRRIFRQSYALDYAYQTPSWSATVLGIGAFGGTAYAWPQYLYPSVTPIPPLTDPRWEKDNYTAIRIPFWALAVALSVAPARYILRAYRNHIQRRRVGHCQQCFYNLTGNISGVCPECGSKVTA